MPRPTNKTDLLTAIDKEWNALEASLESLSPEQMVAPGGEWEWSVKDILTHLIEWQQMVLTWYRAGLKGEKLEIPAPRYKWSQTPQLNQAIFEKHRNRQLDEVIIHFGASSGEILDVIQGLSNDELFTPGRYAWTQKNTLGTYFVSATSSHYLWARNEIRKRFKTKKG